LQGNRSGTTSSVIISSRIWLAIPWNILVIKLHLRVKQKSFDFRQAHGARYDAALALQLYQKMLTKSRIAPSSILENKQNPFTNSRVDTPFQDHPDEKRIYQKEFRQLKVAITEIHRDKNRQSLGAVVIGEPGSGKTHMMMRLAKELLQVNRLLFIRQPNNPDAILYHIYSRVLESLIQKVPETGFTQLEYLIGHSFSKLVSTSRYLKVTQIDRLIMTAFQESPLKIYEIAAEGSERKRKLWGHIEKRLLDWWVEKYSFSGYAVQILKGIVRFCSYSDPRYKSIVQRWLAANSLSPEDLKLVGLEDWQEDMSKEDFSLEAIAVFSKLSLLDEPMLIVFDQLESLGLEHNHRLLENFGEAVKEIFTHVPNSLIILNLFPDRWQHFQKVLSPAVIDRVSSIQIELHLPGIETLRQILEMRIDDLGVRLDELFMPEDLDVILRQPSIRGMLNCAAQYFRFRVQDIPLPSNIYSSSSYAPRTSSPTLSRNTQPINPCIDHLEKELTQRPEKFEPLIGENISTDYSSLQDYLLEKQHLNQQEYKQSQIITDSDDLGKLTTIAKAFQMLKPFDIFCLQLGKRKLPEHLLLCGKQKIVIGFLQVDGNSFTSRIKNWNELVINDQSIQHQLWRDTRLPDITGKVGKEEIMKLNYSKNGQFLMMNKGQRLDFEIIYQLIIDIQNRDLEIELQDAIEIVKVELKNSWICKIFAGI
jgi:hypothetical protein